jgi:hypothetical protein
MIREERFLEATMKAMIIYEEYDCAARANALLKRASERAEGEEQWSVKLWRLDMLERPAMAHEARRDAADAHLMVLAVGRRGELPAGLLDWLEGWANRRRVGDAALAEFHGGSVDAFSATATPELSEFARRHGLSMIFGDVSPAEYELGELWVDLHEREVAQTATMAHILEQVSPGSYRHWGIND